MPGMLQGHFFSSIHAQSPLGVGVDNICGGAYPLQRNDKQEINHSRKRLTSHIFLAYRAALQAAFYIWQRAGK